MTHVDVQKRTPIHLVYRQVPHERTVMLSALDEFLTARLFLGLLLIPFLVFSTYAADRDLLEAAKREGTVVVYGSIGSDTGDPLMAAFEKKYGIKVDFFRGSTPAVSERASTEFRAGKPLYDVVLVPSNHMRLLDKQGLFAKYVSPESQYYDKTLVDPVLGPNYRIIPVGIVYNTRAIKEETAPASYDDLLDPKWKGKIVLPDPSAHSLTTNWMASLQLALGSQEKAAQWIRALAAQEPMLVRSMGPSGRAVASGEKAVGIGFPRYVFSLGKDGAPLDYSRDLSAYVGDGNFAALSSKPPHPNAGKVFIDFLLSAEGATVMANIGGEFVTRENVTLPLKGSEQIIKRFVEMVPMTAKELTQKKNEYKAIFK